MSESLLGGISDTITSPDKQAETELEKLAKAKAREIAEEAKTTITFSVFGRKGTTGTRL